MLSTRYFPPITPNFGQKSDLGGQKKFVNRPIKPLGKIFRTQKNRLPKSFYLSELQELEVRICVFHKFEMSMRAKHQ